MSTADDLDTNPARVLGPEPGLGPVAIVLKLFVSVVLLFLMLLTCVDVTGRYLFSRPVAGASELTQFAMGLLIFGALPLVTVRREHVTIELLGLIVGERARHIQAAVATLTSLAALGLMSWQLWMRAVSLSRYSDGSIYLGVPLAPFAYFMSVMSGIAALALLVSIARKR